MLGFGWQRGRGVRGGGITDIEDAERAIRAAVGQAEDMADTTAARGHRQPVLRPARNRGCSTCNGRSAAAPVASRRTDIRRVMLEGRAPCRRRRARDRSTSLPLTFSVDDTDRVADPRGLYCATLTARLHVVDAAATALRTLGACIARCDLEIAELVSAPMAAGLATLVEDERELGATVIDMGGGTTGIAVFAEGQLLHTAQLPVGGVHVTNDIARVLSTPWRMPSG